MPTESERHGNLDFHLRSARSAAREISRLSRVLVEHAAQAHDDGASWERIAGAVEGRYPNGTPAALGDLLPGGRSVTTVRQFVRARSGR